MLNINPRNIVRYYKRHADLIRPAVGVFSEPDGDIFRVCPLTVALAVRSRVKRKNLRRFFLDVFGNSVSVQNGLGATFQEIHSFYRGYDSPNTVQYSEDIPLNENHRLGIACRKAVDKYKAQLS